MEQLKTSGDRLLRQPPPPPQDLSAPLQVSLGSQVDKVLGFKLQNQNHVFTSGGLHLSAFWSAVCRRT